MKEQFVVRRCLTMIAFIVLTAFFQSLCMTANIGVCACWDSVSLNVYELTGFKVGDFSIVMNCVLVSVQLLILRKRFPKIKLLQVPAAVLFGVMVNFFYYQILDFELPSYAMRVLFWGISMVGLGVCCAVLNVIDLIAMPPEVTSSTISKEFHLSYGKLRVGVDAGCIAVSLALTLFFGLSFKFREGTVGGMLILGPLTGVLMKKFRPQMEKLKLCGK